MIGQANTKRVLGNLVENGFPRFLILAGQRGSGKRTILQWLLSEHSMEHVIIEDQKIDSIRAVVESSYTLMSPKIFIFPDAHKMNIQAQNAFLKTLEEPPMNAHFIMTVNSLWNLLSTIRSRALSLGMTHYTKEELRNFTTDDTLLRLCSNPGEIIRYLNFDWEALLSHCEKVSDVLGRVNLANVFNVLKSVGEENYDLIIPTLQYVYGKRLLTEEFAAKKLKIIQETSLLLEHSNTINVRNALETMFIKLWEVS